MKKFNESISCCNRILQDYPNNGDVLFDKASNFAMLSNFDDALDLLEHAIFQGIQYKVKAKHQNHLKIYLIMLDFKI